jgi:hypothetical protein
MGFGKKFKAAFSPAVDILAPATGMLGRSQYTKDFIPYYDSSRDYGKRQEAGIEQTNRALAEQQAATAEQARLKLIADESVRAQEELARKKTVFGGDTQQQTLERRKLLGI